MPSNIAVVPVTSARERKQFFEFPYHHYKGDPYWVPQLRMDRKAMFDDKKHPFYEHAEVQSFLAYKDGKPAGTVVANINHRHNEFHGEKIGFFGFFDTIQDPDVSSALLNTATEWVRARGMTAIRGPVSFSTNEEFCCGLLVDGFDSSPVVMMAYNPPYYGQYIESAGFTKVQDLYAYAISTSLFSDGTENAEKLSRIAERVKQRYGFEIRHVNLKQIDQEVERFKKIYNAAWERNWGFVPMTERELDAMAANLKLILDKDLAMVVYLNGEPVGFSITLPDINQPFKGTGGRLLPAVARLYYYRWFNKFTICRVLAMGVLKEHRMRGISVMMYYETAKAALPKGYKMGEMSWILESNQEMNADIQALGGHIYKTYRVYEKPLV
jgi:GNAT superfamily N-acetyltransferase